MAHTHSVHDDDLYFSINPYTKAITFMDEEPLVIAKGDHNSERFTFEIPRIVEGHDMMLCNLVEIHWLNISSGMTSSRVSDVYQATDLQISPDDENNLVFSWLISQNATQYVGSLNFAIRFACTTGDKVDYSWRSAAFSGISIVDSIDNSEIVTEQYSDVLRKWYMELLMAETQGINGIKTAAKEKIEEIKSIDIVAIVEKETIDRIEAVGDEIVETMRNKIYVGETELIDTIPIYDGITEVIE